MTPRAAPARLPALFLALLAIPALAMPAWAAPFCVTVQGLPDQCIYVDGAECGRRATQLGGICTANGAEIRTPPGPGLFCLAEGGHAVACVYADRDTCNAEARRRKSTCIPASAPPSGSVDPFAPQRPY
jgi:hypothetical protein